MLDMLKILVLPPAGPLLLALGGVALLGCGWRWGRWPLGLGLVSACLLTTEAVVEPLAQWYVGALPTRETLQRAQAWADREDAVVLVLGAGIREGGSPDGDFDLRPLTAERLRRGLWWSRSLRLPLAFTGGVPKRAEAGTPSESQVVARTLMESGQPPALWLDDQARDTRGNARYSAKHLQQRGTRKLLLVTHGLHMPRALAHFRAELPQMEILPAPLHRDRLPGWSLSDFLPSPEGAARGAYLCYEWAARLAGR